MVRAFFVREDIIDFCLHYIDIHNIYCQEFSRNPKCINYDSNDEFKKCLESVEYAKAELKAMCDALNNTEFKDTCGGD